MIHPAAYQDAEQFVSKYLPRDRPLTILDVGSLDVNGALRPLFDKPAWDYTGMDITEGPNVDIVSYHPYAWPFMAQSFSVVVSTQVLEHVPQPWAWVREIARVLKPGGLTYVCAPHTHEYHEYPIDCWRVWPEGMRGLFQHVGLDVIECYKSATDTTGIGRK